MNYLYRFLLLVFVCSASLQGIAYAHIPSPDIPQLLFKENGTPQATLLETLDTQVQIRGLLAETTLTMTFRNPHNRVLEGELNLPLPEGATVSGYGLDIDGQLVAGVVVEKTQARVAFETEVRKGVDPGLVEWTRGNRFRTRVYPIPARGTRMVQVQYVSEIDGDANQAVFVLPMQWDGVVKNFSLKVEVVRSTEKPQASGGLANFEFKQWQDRWIAETTQTNAKLTGDLRIAIPNLPAQLVSIEKAAEDVFFLVHDSPPAVDKIATTSPASVALFWDASLSREVEDKGPELALLQAALSQWQHLQVEVFILRDTTERLGSWSIRGGDAAELFKALQNLVYDGGTNLTRLPTPDSKTVHDLTLLFSDGLGNIGHTIPDTSTGPIYTITSRSDANHIFLRHLATTSGGEHLNLNRHTPLEAAAKIGDNRLRFMGVKQNSGVVTDVYPQGNQPVDERLEVSGRLLTETAEIILQYGRNGNITYTVPIRLQRDQASDTGLVPRFWAQQRVAELAVFPQRNRAVMLELGQRFGLVTPNTSLLVLETLAQYLEHDVEPPLSRPQLYAAWQAQKATIAQQKISAQATHLAQVVALWENRVKWWQTDFTHAQQRMQSPGKLMAVESVALQFAATAPVTTLRMASSAAAAAARKQSGHNTRATIHITAWDPQTPYMAILKAAHKRGRAYESYINQRIGYGDSPAYYLDVATWFYTQGQPQRGRRIISSVLDLDLDDAALLRVVAQRVLEAEDYELAISTFEDVLSMRPEEPQSYRDLALALARRGELRLKHARGAKNAVIHKGLKDLERAMTLLHHVVMHDWDRFDEIELIALMELNRLWALADQLPGAKQDYINRPALGTRLIKNLDVDLRIVLAWDADLTDIDIWVTEPTGEKAFYQNPLSAIGGKVSRDFTQGYGPEEYSLRVLIPGAYRIEANYYGSSQQTLIGPATVKATVFTN